MVERIDKSRIASVDGTDLDRFVESDFLIRSGLCPNGHGLMLETDLGQECPTCCFSCNVMSERPEPS